MYRVKEDDVIVTGVVNLVFDSWRNSNFPYNNKSDYEIKMQRHKWRGVSKIGIRRR